MNLILFSGLIFLLVDRHTKKAFPSVSPSTAKHVTRAADDSTARQPMKVEPQPFRWQQLESPTDYRVFIANLRAIGCPEATIEDIAKGDANRAFSWERHQLGLDGSGSGPWSRFRETQLVATLLAEPSATGSTQSVTSRSDVGRGETATTTVPASSAGDQMQPASAKVPESEAQNSDASASSYPLFLQNVDWNALGFSADQQVTITQVRQQFLNDTSGLTQNGNNTANPNPDSGNQDSASAGSSDSSALTQWQIALQNANQQLRDLLGSQAYMEYELQQYKTWFTAQVDAHTGNGNLFINPDAFSMQ
jgi:hypothetical protein